MTYSVGFSFRFKDSFFSLLWGGSAFEVCVIDMIGNLDTRNINGSGGGNNCGGGASSHWDTIDLEWTGNKEETRSQLLQENDTFTTEGTSEHDEDSSWGDARSEGSGVLAEWFLTVTLNFSSDGKSWVVFWLSDGNDLKIVSNKPIKMSRWNYLSGATILGTTDLLFGDGASCLLFGLGNSLGALVLCTSAVHL